MGKKTICFECENCGKETKQFSTWYKRTEHHCCSRKCSWELKKKRSIKICKNCGNRFYSNNHQKTKMFCSHKCRAEQQKKQVSLICETCGKEYSVHKYRDTSRYCSGKCKYQGRIKSTEREQRSCVHCNRVYTVKISALRYGEKRKFQTRFCSKKCKDGHLVGKNHPNYVPIKARATVKDKLAAWSKEVKQRDGYKCVKCDCKKKYMLQAHHIISYMQNKELRFEVNNGMTLCIDCHAKEHPAWANLIKANPQRHGKKTLD